MLPLLFSNFNLDDLKGACYAFRKKSAATKGVSQELRDMLNEIMEQAEARYREWWGEAA